MTLAIIYLNNGLMQWLVDFIVGPINENFSAHFSICVLIVHMYHFSHKLNAL